MNPVPELGLHEDIKDIGAIALRIKAERDAAVLLLVEVLHYVHIGHNGVYKTKVRKFLKEIGQ